MPARLRRAIAALGVLVFLAAYVWAVIAIGERVPSVWWIQLIYYGLAGLLWGVPLLPLLSWAERGGTPRRGRTDTDL